MGCRAWLRVRNGIGCAVGLCLVSGCSFAFVNTVPEQAERLAYFDCTSSRLAPVLDGVVGGVFVIAGAATIIDYGAADGSRAALSGGAAVAIAGAAVASAVYGFTEANKCAKAKDALLERTLRAAPGTPVREGCNYDLECRGERICVDRQCVDAPKQPSAPASETSP